MFVLEIKYDNADDNMLAGFYFLLGLHKNFNDNQIV